ncbi:MAG: CheB methylesterase [bacterium]|nr:CheB methylesterase [bacterium]
MANRDIVVIGASAGGVQALTTLVSALPVQLEAALFVVLHLSPDFPSHLPAILQRVSRLPVVTAEDRHEFRSGHIYVAPPDRHLLLDERSMRVTRGPKENRSRPAIDALFRSAAYVHGERVIALVLSGMLDDGTAGLWSVKERGGTTLVQAPADAKYSSMPRSALQHVDVDYVPTLSEIPELLMKLTREPATAKGRPVSKELEIETKIAMEGRGLQMGVMELGPVSPYTCPECHGVLVALQQGGVPRFRCHTGHAYSINNLLAEATGHVEHNLWNAIRGIEESMLLLQHLARHARGDGDRDGDGALLDERARQAQKRADLVREALMSHEILSKEYPGG